MDTIFVDEFPKTALNRKPSDVYDAASQGPVSLSDNGTSRFVLMSRRVFDERFAHADPRIARETNDIPDAEGALLEAELTRIIESDE